MALQKQKHILCFVILVLGLLIANSGGTHAETHVKKDLEKVIKASTQTVTELKSAGNQLEEKVETAGGKSPPNEIKNPNEQKVESEQKPQQQAQVQQKEIEKTGNNKQTLSDDDNKTTQSSSAPVISSSSSTHQLYHQDETILGSNEEISDSLKTGFYFFVALSLSAVLFIIFKVYRLRLSRAERKYGVQGDRSTQELTPLPLTIEDGHSDDEDQTLFDQRQNIRIL